MKKLLAYCIVIIILAFIMNGIRYLIEKIVAEQSEQYVYYFVSGWTLCIIYVSIKEKYIDKL